MVVVAAIVLTVSVAAMLLVASYVELGRTMGQEWSSFDGPQPVWPAVVGFGAMNIAALSGVVLAALLAFALVREIIRKHHRRRG